MAERRKNPRFLVTRSATIIPIDNHGGPDESNLADGFTVDISHEGIQLETAGISQLPNSHLIVGVEGDDGVMCYAAVETLHTTPSPAGLRVGGRFLFDRRSPLREQDIGPTLDPHSSRLKTRLPPETLARWAALGVIAPVRCERVLVCPQCQGLPAVREGCRACGSADWWSKVLIHHFACAHVGYVEEFEAERDLKCPKCRTAALVVGADFEYLQSPFQCRECGWSDTELELIGTCLSCSFRFPFCNACAEEFTIYHVNRLDPLAFITSS